MGSSNWRSTVSSLSPTRSVVLSHCRSGRVRICGGVTASHRLQCGSTMLLECGAYTIVLACFGGQTTNLGRKSDRNTQRKTAQIERQASSSTKEQPTDAIPREKLTSCGGLRPYHRTRPRVQSSRPHYRRRVLPLMGIEETKSLKQP